MKLVDANLKLHQTLGIAMGISEEVESEKGRRWKRFSTVPLVSLVLKTEASDSLFSKQFIYLPYLFYFFLFLNCGIIVWPGLEGASRIIKFQPPFTGKETHSKSIGNWKDMHTLICTSVMYCTSYCWGNYYLAVSLVIHFLLLSYFFYYYKLSSD